MYYHLNDRDRVITHYNIDNQLSYIVKFLANKCNTSVFTIYREIKRNSIAQVSKLEKFMKCNKPPIYPKILKFHYYCNCYSKLCGKGSTTQYFTMKIELIIFILKD